MILFAKAPVPGRVKTRLASVLGTFRAAELHCAFVRDMLELLRSFGRSADIELHTDIITDAWQEASVARHLQSEGDLSLRMLHALGAALEQGRPQVMIVGSDAPTLPREHLAHLLVSQADVAFGPCEDGGYYAISCRKIHPDMFRRVTWSTRDVLEQSERAARANGLTVARGPLWYDVDEPEDLERLLASPDLPRFTAEWKQRNA